MGVVAFIIHIFHTFLHSCKSKVTHYSAYQTPFFKSRFDVRNLGDVIFRRRSKSVNFARPVQPHDDGSEVPDCVFLKVRDFRMHAPHCHISLAEALLSLVKCVTSKWHNATSLITHDRLLQSGYESIPRSSPQFTPERYRGESRSWNVHR